MTDELVMAPWPHPLQVFNPILLEVHRHYLHEHLTRRGANVSRPRATFRNINAFFGFDADPQQLKIADWQRYEDHRYSQGVKAPTVRREITFHLAAMNHCKKRERIAVVPYIEKPSGDVLKKRRAATVEEYQLLMRKGLMTYRIRMFFRIAYFTGHRAEAIETLTWDRVDFVERLIDFNIPGARLTNKRRNGAFPITDDLLPLLEAARVRRDYLGTNDPYVIGGGRNGKPSSTGAECKAAWRSVGVDVDGLNRHCLRKTFVTERLRKNLPRDIVAQLIADNPETMSKHYATFASADMQRVANG